MIEQLILNKTSKIGVGVKVITEENNKLVLREIKEINDEIGMVKLCDGNHHYPAKTKQVYKTVMPLGTGQRDVIGIIESEEIIRSQFPNIN